MESERRAGLAGPGGAWCLWDESCAGERFAQNIKTPPGRAGRVSAEIAMDHLTRLQRAVDYIETHLKHDPTTEQIGRQACFSMWHFQRMFSAAVGLGVQRLGESGMAALMALHRRLRLRIRNFPIPRTCLRSRIFPIRC